MFDLGFRRSFMPLPQRPRRIAGLGQEDPGWDTSGNEPEATVDIPGLYTSIDQMPDSTGSVPGLYTSIDQDTRPTESVPGLVTQKDLQESLKNPTPSTDWGKVASALVKGAGESYAAYQKAQTTFDAARAKAGLPPLPLQTAAASSSGISPNVMFLVGGLAAVSLLVVLIRA